LLSFDLSLDCSFATSPWAAQYTIMLPITALHIKINVLSRKSNEKSLHASQNDHVTIK
jgi:hypothetical protein